MSSLSNVQLISHLHELLSDQSHEAFSKPILIKTLIRSDPRSPMSPRINAFGPPNQSRSFKILQQVTNTFGNDSDESEVEQQRIDSEPMQEQQPLYSRPLGPDEMNENQMRRLQLGDNDRAFMNRVKNQGN